MKISGNDIVVDDGTQHIRAQQVGNNADYYQESDNEQQAFVARQVRYQPEEGFLSLFGLRVIFQVISVCHSLKEYLL